MDILRYAPVGFMLIATAGALMAAVAVAAPALHRRDHARALLLAARALLGGALLVILAITLFVGTGADRGLNLVPGAGIFSALTNLNPSIGVANLLGNVLLFVPVGLLARPALGWRFRRTVLSTAVLAVALELLQLAIGGAADIDDVLLRTLGAAAGAWLARALAASRPWERRTEPA